MQNGARTDRAVAGGYYTDPAQFRRQRSRAVHLDEYAPISFWRLGITPEQIEQWLPEGALETVKVAEEAERDMLRRWADVIGGDDGA